MSILLIAGEISAQTPDFFGTGMAAQGSSGFEEAFKKGVEAAAARNFAEAERQFQIAREDASARKDKEAKSRARDAEKRVGDFYAPYFSNMDEAASFQRNRDFRVAQERLMEAQALLDKYRNNGDPAFNDLDASLSTQTDQQFSMVNQQRLQEFDNRYQAGQQRLYARDFDGAVREMEAAKALLFEDLDAALMERAALGYDQAHYQKNMLEGEQAAVAEDYETALEKYKTARGFNDSYEVQQKIEAIAGNFHAQMLDEARKAFDSGDYETSLEKLDQANEYMLSPASEEFQTNAQVALREKGRATAREGNFDEALEIYNAAARFKNDEVVRVEIEQVKNLVKHEKDYHKALELLKKEKLRSAQKKLKAASRHDYTPEVDELIRKIDAYYLHLDQGRYALKAGNPKEALPLFQEAEKLFQTAEIKKYIVKASGGKSGMITDDDLY